MSKAGKRLVDTKQRNDNRQKEKSWKSCRVRTEKRNYSRRLERLIKCRNHLYGFRKSWLIKCSSTKRYGPCKYKGIRRKSVEALERVTVDVGNDFEYFLPLKMFTAVVWKMFLIQLLPIRLNRSNWLSPDRWFECVVSSDSHVSISIQYSELKSTYDSDHL